MPSIKAIFFDIGDTLVFDDPPLRERFWIATQEVGIHYVKDALPAAFRVGEQYAVRRYLEGAAYTTLDVLRETAHRILSGVGAPDMTERECEALARVFVDVPYTRYAHPQAFGLLKTLRARGFRIGAISDWEQTLSELLAELALMPYFDALAVSSIVGATKPSRRLFEDGLNQMGARAEDAIHVGDWHELDIAGAQSAGMDAVLFDHQGRRAWPDCRSTKTFEELTDLLLSLPCPVH